MTETIFVLSPSVFLTPWIVGGFLLGVDENVLELEGMAVLLGVFSLRSDSEVLVLVSVGSLMAGLAGPGAVYTWWGLALPLSRRCRIKDGDDRLLVFVQIHLHM